MDFKEKYTIKDEPEKVKITPEAFALGDIIQELINKLEQIRRQ